MYTRWHPGQAQVEERQGYRLIRVPYDWRLAVPMLRGRARQQMRDAIAHWQAAVLQVITMTVPRIFAPIAVVWLGLSHLLGAVMSRVVLTVIFFLVVTPIGLVRRLMGKDSLRLRAFKAGDDSVMLPRNHVFSDADLERPY